MVSLTCPGVLCAALLRFRTGGSLGSCLASGRRPDLTVVLDIDVETSRRRTAERSVSDPFEAEDRAFTERVRACYLERAARAPRRNAVIDAGADTRTVERAIDGALDEQALLEA